MMLTEYETTVIIRPDISGEAVETTLDRVRDTVTTNGGKLLALNHWGKKRLAYDIEKQSRGIYVHAQYLGPNNLVAELERNLRISDNVLRYLTVRVAQNVDPTEREEQAYEAPKYDAADEPAEEEAFDTRGSSRDDDDHDDRGHRGRDHDRHDGDDDDHVGDNEEKE